MSALNWAIRPKLADVYFDWEADVAQTLQPSIASTLALAATSNWGPVNTVVELLSWADYLENFGASDTPLKRAVWGAFKGHGVNGFGGAGAVLAYRQATSSAAKATKTLLNTAGTPASAIMLTARQPGTRGNDFRVTVQAGSVVGQNELLILDGALVVEEYAHTATDLQSLVDEINLVSQWFTATLLVDGTSLALVSSAVVSGGNDGSSITGAEWTATFSAFDRQRWGYFGPYNVTDPTIRASIVAWIQDRNSNGQRCMTAFGGVLDEALATAIGRTIAINDYNIINLGEGSLRLLDDNDRVCSTAEFVTRYLGARAWRGESRDDIFVRFGDVDLVNGASLDEQQQALDGGVVVFSRDTDVNAPVFIREAVNTYVDDSQSPLDENGAKKHPKALYRRIKNIAIQQGIEQEIGDWARGGSVLGDLPVSDKTRDTVRARLKLAYQVREDAQVVQPGWSVDVAGVQSDDDDFIQYTHGFHPRRSLRQILNTARIG